MDKRKFLFTRPYKRSDGRIIEAKIYQKQNNRGMNCRMVYGSFEVYISSYVTYEKLDSFVIKCLNKNKDMNVYVPYMVEDKYFYVFGKKQYITRDKNLSKFDMYFYVSNKVKDPITIYKKKFLEYLEVRVRTLAKQMGLDLSSWKIQTGLFLSYYGVCFPTKHILKFDYRLFAFKESISDSIIYHELAHILDIHHDERFYKIINMYCGDYEELQYQLKNSYFDGRKESYVI